MPRNGLNIGLLAVAAVTPLIGGLHSFMMCDGTWFARSGAITVLIAAWIQHRLVKQAQGLIDENLILGHLGVIPDPLSHVGAALARGSLWLLVAGTLIWGYGDLGIGKLLNVPQVCQSANPMKHVRFE
jgi:hypothetical protein